MKTSFPQLDLRLCLFLAGALLLSSCQGRKGREVLGLNIARSVTHIAAGQSARLTAYEEYREPSGSLMSVQAANAILRSPVTARWSVSDPALAAINDDGTLTALKQGHVTVTSTWGNYTAATVIEVVKGLPLPTLPQISSLPDALCKPLTADLRFEEDRTLRFRMSFDRCEEIELETKAGDAALPWSFETQRGRVEILEAHGPIAMGVVRANDGETFSFTTWSAGAGAYPLSLVGKRVLLIGDSMGQGIAPFLQKKVEAAGGRFTSAPEQSSTIIWWQGSGRLRALIAEHQPDIIFIALGSNELFTKDAQARAPIIQHMVADIGVRAGFWIGPPSWKPGSQLVPVIEENFQTGHFYNSDHLEVPRGPDGKHPTLEGYERWVELIWHWYARTL